jgi:phosphoesterase RecJ-like protein
MMLDELQIQSASEKIKNAQRIMLVTHKRPDGDAIGSLLGLGLVLESIGKEVQMISVDGVPLNLRHLTGSELIQKLPNGDVDLVCVLDCSELSRVGEVRAINSAPDINIDHHRTNLHFAKINLVDEQAVSTTQIIGQLIAHMQLHLTKPAADALLTGLITDTVGFRTANMTSEALRLAANFMDEGCDLHELYRRALVVRSFESARLWGAGLKQIDRDGHLVWTTLTLIDRKEAGYPGTDDADLVNVLVSVDDADIALIFLEQPDQKVKVSWRSRPEIDVSGVASHFGGGGHANAAGADIPGKLEDVQAAVLDATRSLLEFVQ